MALILRRSASSLARLDIYLPDISQALPDPPVQVPYLPDFWHSKPTKPHPSPDPPLPKLVLITGADTHHGGGPLHNLHDEYRELSRITDLHVLPPDPIASPPTLLQDVAQDLGIPPSFGVSKAVRDLLAQQHPSDKYRWQSRELSKDDMNGIGLLIALLAGSWITAGILAPATHYEGS